MREEAEVNGCLDDLLDREELVCLEQLLAGDIGISRGVEELHDLAVSHQGELSLMRGQKARKPLREGTVVAINLLAETLHPCGVPGLVHPCGVPGLGRRRHRS